MGYVAAHNIFSPLGATSAATFAAVAAGRSAVAAHAGLLPDGEPAWVARLPANWADGLPQMDFSPFELLLLASVADAASRTDVALDSNRTVFVVATTKGNIGLLDEAPEVSAALAGRLSLAGSARAVARHFGNSNAPVVVSNACTSGVAALLVAQRLLASGQYDAAVVTGADTVSRFVLAGFQAFQALSAGPCKPFSADRDGINLGEAAATLVLTNQPPAAGRPQVRLAGGALSNDANHISGPSRTGAELAQAIGEALAEAGLTAAAVDFVSAHGTATPYNDAMEANAFALSGVQVKPVYSVKGALGHTLGAAGLVESVLSVLALTEGCLLPTAGYSQPMQPTALSVAATARPAGLRVALKTASGFGGCNGALVFVRE